MVIHTHGACLQQLFKIEIEFVNNMSQGLFGRHAIITNNQIKLLFDIIVSSLLNDYCLHRFGGFCERERLLLSSSMECLLREVTILL